MQKQGDLLNHLIMFDAWQKGHMMKINNTGKLLMLFTSFILLWVASAALHSTMMWYLVINLTTLFIIYKYKTFDKKEIATGVLLGVLCMPSNLIMGLSVILPYISASMIFKNSQNKIFLYKNGKKKNAIVTVLLIFVIGGILGGINVLLAMGSMPLNLSFQLQWIFDALRAGVLEEVFFRFFFFALCVYLTKDQPLSRFQNLLCYGIMVIPYVLIHFNLETFRVSNVIMLTLLFGIPFAWMQRRSNLVSAIGSHAFVDFVRFCMLGM